MKCACVHVHASASVCVYTVTSVSAPPQCCCFREETAAESPSVQRTQPITGERTRQIGGLGKREGDLSVSEYGAIPRSEL